MSSSLLGSPFLIKKNISLVIVYVIILIGSCCFLQFIQAVSILSNEEMLTRNPTEEQQYKYLPLQYNITTVGGGDTFSSSNIEESPIGRPISMDYYQNYLVVIDGVSGLIKKLSFASDSKNNQIPSKVEVIAGVSGFVGWFQSQMAKQQEISPLALAVSKKNGEVLFVEHFGSEIKKIDTSGRIVLVASNNGNNEKCKIDSETTVENPGFFQIQDIHYSMEGNEEYLYIIETHNHWIRRLNLMSGKITVVAGKCGVSGFVDGPVATARLTSPSSVHVKYDSRTEMAIVYIADTYNIRKVENGIVTNIAGSSQGLDLPILDGYQANNVSILPHKLFVNHNDEILFTELIYNGIRKITPDGKIYSIPSSNILPYSIVQFKNSNDVYVASVESNLICKIDANNRVTTAFGNGEKVYFGNGKPATQSQSAPHHISVSSKNGKDVITMVDLLGYPKIRTIENSIISHTLGISTKSTDHKYLDGLMANQVVLDSNTFTQRVGDDLYFSQDDTIYKLSSPSGKVTRIVGTRYHNTGDGSVATSALLNHPQSVFYSTRLEMLLIADTKNQKIRGINKNGIISTIVGMDSSSIINTFIGQPLTIFERNGFIYFSTNSEVHKVNIDEKKISTVIGTGIPGMNAIANRPLEEIQLDSPEGLFVTEDDTIYISDSNNYRILRVIDDRVEVIFSGEKYFIRASSMFVNTKGDVYLADMLGGKVKMISSTGNVTTLFEIYCPQQLIISADNDIYVTHLPGMLSKFSQGKLTLLAGNRTVSSNNLNDPTSFHFTFLNGLSFGKTEQEIIFAEPKRGLIRKLSNGLVSTIAGGIGDGLPASQALLYDPASFIVTPDNEIIIADTGHHVIRKVSKDGIISTLYGTPGVHGYNDESDASKTLFHSPSHLSLTRNGDLFVVDHRNFIIRKISKGVISTIIGIPQKHAFINEGSTGKETLLSYPSSIIANDQYILFTEHSSSGIFKLVLSNENAIVEKIAGFDFGFSGDGDSKSARLTFARSLAFSNDERTVYFIDDESDRIRTLTPYCPNEDYKVSHLAQMCELTSPKVIPPSIPSPKSNDNSNSYVLVLVATSVLSFLILLITLLGTVYHLRKNASNYNLIGSSRSQFETSNFH